ESGLEVGDLVGNHTGFEAGVRGDLLQRGFDGDLDDVGAGCFVTLECEVGEGSLARLDQGDAATGDDSLFHGSLGVAHGIFDAVLGFLELNLGGGSGLDDCNTAGQLGQTLLQLLTVVVGVRVLDLGADLCDPSGDLLGVSRAFDDGGLVLGDDDLTGGAQQIGGHAVELEPDFLGHDLATGEDGDVGQLRLAAVAESRSLDGHGLEGALELVEHQDGQGFALDVFGDDKQRLVRLLHLLEDGQQFLHVRDLGVDDEDVGILKDSFLAIGVGDEVTGDVTLVEAHTLGQFELECEGVGLLNGVDAFLADLVDGLSDQFTDGGSAGGDAGSGGDLFLGLDLDGVLQQDIGDSLDGLLDAALEAERISTGCHVAQAFAHEGLSEHGSGGGSIACDVVSLLGDLLDEFGADLLVGVLEFDLLGNGDAIVRDGRCSPLLFEHDIATAGSKGHLDRVRELVESSLESPTSFFVECNHLCHSGL